MVELSPAAQAIVNAVEDVSGYGRATSLMKARMAAALRAAADQVVPICSAPCYQNDFEYGVWSAKEDVRLELITIAYELEKDQ